MSEQQNNSSTQQENQPSDKSSRFSGFYKLSIEERIQKVKEFSNLTDADCEMLQSTLGVMKNNYFIENVIGVMQVPLGVATNFKVNGKDYLVPMAVEEASVVAAASNSAKITLENGGFFTSNTGPVMIGQIQCVNVMDPFGAKMRILEKKADIIAKANEQDPILVKFGGGCRDINVKVIDSLTGPMVITELLVDCGDAMGANPVNTMTEGCAPLIERIAKGKVFLRIISNLADKRIVRARAVFSKKELATDTMSGEEVVDGIMEAYAFAEADPYRATTHNKGIMNAISAIALATANDWRAIEAGCHAYAARNGTYAPLTTYEKNSHGDLVGTIEVPLAFGLVGGAARIHPIAQVVLKIMVVKKAVELAEVTAAVGLAQNFGALRALASTGIQAGHMKLHLKNLAYSVIKDNNDDPALVDKIVELVSKERGGKITMDRVEKAYKELKGN